MSSLREIKDRIGSVRSTLKITSAMKLVASAKLRRAQEAVEGMRPYQTTLSSILADVQASVPAVFGNTGAQTGSASAGGRVAIVAVAGNSSLCGAFNGNVLRKVNELLAGLGCKADVYSIGRKIADPMRKAGLPNPGAADYNNFVAHPSYEAASSLAQALIDSYEKGVYSRVILVYNHFVSTSRQEVVAETYLPFALPEGPAAAWDKAQEDKYIMEPSASDIVKTLLPQVMRLKIYTMLLDSIASEHAARTIAMQTASDNAKDILDELTLEYNKGRQQQITSEILDIVGGSQQ